MAPATASAFVVVVLGFWALPAVTGVAVAVQGPSGGAVQKVIGMLESMSAKAKKEKHNEEVAFATFTTWCTEERASLEKTIAAAALDIESLTAGIGKLESESKDLGEAVSKLNADVTGFEADMAAATAQREKDHAEFKTTEQDYAESVDALGRAIVVLQKESYDRPAAAAALLQLKRSAHMPAKAQSLLEALVGMSSGQPDAAPEANAYEFQSTSILTVLKNLLDEFNSKLAECRKDEMNSKHAYDMVVQDLTAAIKTAKAAIGEKSGAKGRKEEKAALDTKELSATQKSKADDEGTLGELSAECEEKKMSFQEKSQLRAEEIEAIEQAVGILSQPEVSAAAKTYFSLSQGRTSALALVQRHSSNGASAGRSAGVRRHLREFLEAEGRRLHSQRFALLVERVQADPFAKVKSMIDAMITRLLEEANGDADHEGFCDKEFGLSKITRTKLSEEIDSLSAAVAEGNATILQLTEKVATLSQELSSLASAVQEAVALRASEKAANEATVKDSKEAQAAVTAATAVLKDFYAKALKTTAFVQAPVGSVKMGSEEWTSLANPDFEGTVDKNHKAGMQTFGAAYKGDQDTSAGVMALLEVVLSDFATLEAETTAAEAAGVKSHDQFMVESKKTKATKERQVEMLASDKARAESRLQEDIYDLKATQDKLLAADRYHERLVPQCIDQGMTFEERTKAREAEIASLKEALRILNSEDIETSAL